jgi:hypothetical protein
MSVASLCRMKWGKATILGDHNLTTICVSPPELSDGQLLAYLDHPEANQEIGLHLTSCSFCRQKAESVERFQKTLTTQLYRVDCPSSLELGEYHLHMLPASQMLVISQHVRECPHCASEVAELESFLGEQTATAGSQDSFLGRAKVLIARLVGGGDLTFTPTPAALRGEGKGPITFAAEGIIIVLDIQPTMDGKANILGQVAADHQDDWTGALVELRRDSLLQISTTVDDLGAFHCEGVMPGQQELRIIPKIGSVVVISNFEVPG